MCGVIGIDNILSQDFAKLKDTFYNNVVLKRQNYDFGEVVFRVLSDRGVLDNQANLTEKGYFILKDIAEFFND